MSIDFTPSNPEAPPSKIRIMAIVIHNGVCNKTQDEEGNEVAAFSQTPFVELVVQGCELMEDANGDPIPNPLGLSAYEDKAGYMTSYRVSDPASLASFMTLWSQMMDGAEGMLEAAVEAGAIKFNR